jgi:hypothetical protein
MSGNPACKSCWVQKDPALDSDFQFTLCSMWEDRGVKRRHVFLVLCMIQTQLILSQGINYERYRERSGTAPGFTSARTMDPTTDRSALPGPRGWGQPGSAARQVNGGARDENRGRQSFLFLPPAPLLPGHPRGWQWSSRTGDAAAAAGATDYSGKGLTGTTQRLGSLDFHVFSHGVMGVTQRIGAFQFHHFSNGLSGSSQRIGDFGYTIWNDGTVTNSQRLGAFDYYFLNDGTSGVSQRIGDFLFYNDSKGRHCWSYRIGFQQFLNCR